MKTLHPLTGLALLALPGMALAADLPIPPLNPPASRISFPFATDPDPPRVQPYVVPPRAVAPRLPPRTATPHVPPRMVTPMVTPTVVPAVGLATDKPVPAPATGLATEKPILPAPQVVIPPPPAQPETSAREPAPAGEPGTPPTWLDRFGPFLRSQLEMIVTGSITPAQSRCETAKTSGVKLPAECAPHKKPKRKSASAQPKPRPAPLPPAQPRP